MLMKLIFIAILGAIIMRSDYHERLFKKRTHHTELYIQGEHKMRNGIWIMS